MAKRDYTVGRGKPPVDSQFKKGQSGNPGGKPRAARTIQNRWRVSLEAALMMPYPELEGAKPRTAQDEVVRSIVRSAVRGKHQATKTIMELTEKYAKMDSQVASNEKKPAPEPTSAGGAAKVETQGVTLSQGNSQGNLKNESTAEAITQPDQQIDASAASSSGNTSGTGAPPTDEVIVPPRPKRPTIMIAGQIVQQGD
jgi:hypothetical protein